MLAHNPLHGSGRAGFPHPAFGFGDHAHATQGIRMKDSGQRQLAGEQTPHTIPKNTAALSAPIGIHCALERAREAAGEKGVRLSGGVSTIRQCLLAQLVDDSQRLHAHRDCKKIGRAQRSRLIEHQHGRHKMKYMLLIYADEQAWTESERDLCYGESIDLAHELKANGQYLAAAPLQPVATATSVRVRGGKRTIRDGPFAETREQLGGYFLIDVVNLDEAISVAGRIAVARKGTVEIRPVVDLPNLPT